MWVFVYENTTLAYFGTPEGRVLYTGGKLQPQYIITDQQGNARVTFINNDGAAKVIQENSYYAFGLVMTGGITPTDPNRNLYNGGSEWQNDFGDLPDLMQTYYRNYDQALGRWTGVDPDAESAESLTSYNYSGNNPVMFNDPLGDLMLRNPGSDRHEAWLQANSVFDADGLVDFDRINNVGGGGGPGPYAGYWNSLLNAAYQIPGNKITFTNSALTQIFNAYTGGANGFSYQTQTGFAYYNEDGSIEAGITNTNHVVSFGKANQRGSNWATIALGAITADITTPDPTDSAWPKWATEAVVGVVALEYLNLKNPFYYVTYTKTNAQGKVYVGRSSGYGDPVSIVSARDVNHHIKGYGPAILSSYAPATIPGGYGVRLGDPSYWFIRGSEQLQIQYYRQSGISGNTYNGIGPNNVNRGNYLNEIMKYLK